MEGKIKAKASCHFTTYMDAQVRVENQSPKKWYATTSREEVHEEAHNEVHDETSSATKPKNTLWKPDTYPAYSMERYDAYMKLKPKDIKKALETTIVNQEEACKQIAVMMYQHLHGHRCVRVLAGHTGSGKSFMGENLKRLFPELIFTRPMTSLTKSGWKGEYKIFHLVQGVKPAIFSSADRAGVQVLFPVMFCDEFDKFVTPCWASAGTRGGVENASEMLQYDLLTMLSDSDGKIFDEKKGGFKDVARFSFLFAGSFGKVAEQIAEDESSPQTIGFLSEAAVLKEAFDRNITIQDVMNAGCIPELAGRLGDDVITLDKFDENAFYRILRQRNKGPIAELSEEFGINIKINNKELHRIAHEAYTRHLGMRGAKSVIRRYINEMMWDDCESKELNI